MLSSVILIAVMLLLSAFFSGMEIAFTSKNRLKLEIDRKQSRMFDFIATHQLSPITHWNEISIGKPVKGMTEDECRLAFGKPQTVLESNGEVQWMYSSSFYVFFKNGREETIIK